MSAQTICCGPGPQVFKGTPIMLGFLRTHRLSFRTGQEPVLSLKGAVFGQPKLVEFTLYCTIPELSSRGGIQWSESTINWRKASLLGARTQTQNCLAIRQVWGQKQDQTTNYNKVLITYPIYAPHLTHNESSINICECLSEHINECKYAVTKLWNILHSVLPTHTTPLRC